MHTGKKELNQSGTIRAGSTWAELRNKSPSPKQSPTNYTEGWMGTHELQQKSGEQGNGYSVGSSRGVKWDS